MIRKAARLRMSEGRTLREKCALLTELGFDGFDVVAPSDVNFDELAAAMLDTELGVASVLAGRSLQWSLADSDPSVRAYGREGLVLSLQQASALGASSVLLPSLLPKGVDPTAGSLNSMEELRRVVPVAEELGVCIAIENCWDGYLLSPESFARYVDEFSSPWIVVHFDVGNALVLGLPEEWIAILGPRIHKVDLKDFNRKLASTSMDVAQGVELGQGDCDWPAVVSALGNIAFDGWVSAELPRSGRELLARTSTSIDRMFSREVVTPE